MSLPGVPSRHGPGGVLDELLGRLADRSPVLAALIGGTVLEVERSDWSLNALGVRLLLAEPLGRLAALPGPDAVPAQAALRAVAGDPAEVNAFGTLFAATRAALLAAGAPGLPAG